MPIHGGGGQRRRGGRRERWPRRREFHAKTFYENCWRNAAGQVIQWPGLLQFLLNIASANSGLALTLAVSGDQGEKAKEDRTADGWGERLTRAGKKTLVVWNVYLCNPYRRGCDYCPVSVLLDVHKLHILPLFLHIPADTGYISRANTQRKSQRMY